LFFEVYVNSILVYVAWIDFNVFDRV